MQGRPDVLEREDRGRWWAVAGIGIALSLAYALVPERYTVVREFGIYGVVTVGGWIAVFAGVRRYRPPAPLAWTLIGVGLLVWSIGDIVWSLYDVVENEVPFPSVADGFYVIGYPLFAAGLVLAIRVRRAHQDWKIALDAAALTVAALLLLWVYVARPILDQSVGWVSKLFEMLYPTGDLLLAGVTGLLFLGASWRATSMQLLLVGLLATFGADIAYYTIPTVHGQDTGDVVYLLSLTAFALSALHPSMRALTDPTEDSAKVDSRKRLALLDITREREAQIQLRQLALYDPLTGLANRAFFREQLQQAAAQRHDPPRTTVLLFVDLNDFKSVNDRYGHDAGDSVLKALGTRIQRSIRAGDGAARLGGDEFAVLLTSGVEPEEAVNAAERLLQSISEPIELERGQLSVSASIGISLGSDADEMLKEADAAMYRAKAQRDVGYAFFDPVLDRSAVHRSRRIAELREGLERGEFALHYQPLVDLETHTISGYEALVRWQHPTEGELGPLEFIPLAEETGLIIPIDTWVLDEACRHGTHLLAEHGRHVGMSVNVSAGNFSTPTS
jgi:diguanylate cyclase (GGDEF)-like protein